MARTIEIDHGNLPILALSTEPESAHNEIFVGTKDLGGRCFRVAKSTYTLVLCTISIFGTIFGLLVTIGGNGDGRWTIQGMGMEKLLETNGSASLVTTDGGPRIT